MSLPAAASQLWRHLCLLAGLLLVLRFDSPSQGGALAAPFSSWAGKRSAPALSARADHRADLAQILHDLQELYLLENYEDQEPVVESHYPTAEDYYQVGQKRAPFSSWAGKRSGDMNKRAPFSSWAGKKKRAPFSSWAGKRSAPTAINEDAGEARRLKRSSEEGSDGLDQDGEGMNQEMVGHSRERRGANSFSAWGGKRTALLRRFTRDVHSDAGIVPVKVLRPHRAAFSAWGG